jgi:hypothetical protein
LVLHARGGDGENGKGLASFVAGVIPVVDAAASLLPPAVPQPVGRALVLFLSGSLLLLVAKSAFNLVATIWVIGSGVYAWSLLSRGTSESNSGESQGDDDDDDPLEQARKIMVRWSSLCASSLCVIGSLRSVQTRRVRRSTSRD